MVLEKRKIPCHCQGSNVEPSSSTVVSVPTALTWLSSYYCSVVYQPIDMKMDLKSNEVKICTPLQIVHFHTTQLGTGTDFYRIKLRYGFLWCTYVNLTGTERQVI